MKQNIPMLTLALRRNAWWRKRRLGMLPMLPSDHILDLGCGDGTNLAILQALGFQYIMGVDNDKNIISIAKRKNPTIPFIVAMAGKLPLANNSFDVVLADSVFYHFIESDKVISEIRRVLKDCGRLCFISPHSSILRTMLDVVTVSRVGEYLPFLSKRREVYLLERDLTRQWYRSESDFFSELENHGFIKAFCRVDFLSLVGAYRTIDARPR